ncbi:hypothetical protein PUN28_001053 [Cardiocondyla obscurior]|uniref:Uncharacterized protein n=1 Tax=Cardiocondyla obscurior TaxID=286306 RepID=A0AAW2H2P5_9HYME
MFCNRNASAIIAVLHHTALLFIYSERILITSSCISDYSISATSDKIAAAKKSLSWQQSQDAPRICVLQKKLMTMHMRRDYTFISSTTDHTAFLRPRGSEAAEERQTLGVLNLGSWFFSSFYRGTS